ncbi:hypothetical protein FHR84_002383 [Actinopolyspora biskrensis]|uniref:Uncharacterized protein n=1 Tax=Actinopolyspora biskrensis TaxID=1470178 RepID=A0A852YZT6_9ACTN|nr:hypothetical protein [Actinopolyspora biskrensis]NYH79049.1 hypothetical protein [Actinopolyspora biskrensis]
MWWRLRRVWVAIGSILAAAGALAGILSLVEARQANEVATTPDLRVAEHRVTTKGDVERTRENPETGMHETDRVDAAAVDVVLENRGEQPALVTEIELVVHSAQRLHACQASGPINVTTAYDIRVPRELQSRTVRKSVLYNLDGKSKERVLLSIGPGGDEGTTGWGTIYTVDVRLKQDSGNVLTIPDLVLMQPWRNSGTVSDVVSATLGESGYSGYEECAAENMRTLERAVERPGTHSPKMIELYDRLRAAGAAGAVDGIWGAALSTLPADVPSYRYVRRLEEKLDATVSQRSTARGTILYHPGPFDGPEQARAWCREHGLADSEMCRPRYFTPAE